MSRVEGRGSWPVAELGAVERLRVMAASLPWLPYGERVLDAPFDAVWDAATDFESGVPTWEWLVHESRVTRREGDRMVVRSRLPVVPIWADTDVVVRPGWCWMRNFAMDIGMAAVPEGPDRTRFAHIEGMRAPLVRRLTRPFFKLCLEHDLGGIERLARRRAGLSE